MRFTVQDFPIGSTAYFYKIIDIQNNPHTRKSGEKRFRRETVYFRFTVCRHHHGLIASEHCELDSGYDPKNSRFESEGFLLIPEYLYLDITNRANTRKLIPKQELFLLLREPGCVNEQINEIVLKTKIELNKPWLKRINYKELKNIIKSI